MSKAKRPGQQLRLTVPELLGITNEESAMDIEIRLIKPFRNHPFKVVDDEKMQDLVESIKANGVLSPVLVRETEQCKYEMISGHRRMHAAKLAGLKAIPAIIRDMTDDEATIYMVDANIQREELLPSEKAFAYKMKMDAMKHQGARSDLQNSSTQNGGKLMGGEDLASTQFGRRLETAEIIGQQVGESKNQVRRYIRLTELIPQLLDYVDEKRIQFTVAVEASYIDKEVQEWLYEYIRDNGTIKACQIAALREALTGGTMTQMKMISILNASQPGKSPSDKWNLTDQAMRKYFPSTYSAAQRRSVILELLEEWSRKHTGGNT